MGPKSHRIILHLPDGSTRELSVGEDQHIWDAAHVSGIELPSICHQGRCLTCAARLLKSGDFDSSDAVTYFPADREAGFILLCTACPRSELELQTHQQFAMRQHRRTLGLPAPYSGVSDAG
ncbi:MAG TPA: 2Fe-2S iron-sulfur cluster-binding protein [Terriglobales bacterium]|jgi:ferredoxin|nr:2Fe-2S iron-sulfur cluster-binding protein [Terriglobales bacterium]